MRKCSYNKEEMEEKLKFIINKYGEINAHDFTKYGLNDIYTYYKAFNLNDERNKYKLFEICGIHLKNTYIDTQKENGSNNKIITELPKYIGKGSNSGKLIVDWKECQNKKLDILYNNKIYKVTTHNYNGRKIEVEYNGEINNINVTSFLKGQFKTLLQLRHNTHIYKNGDILIDYKGNKIKILELVKLDKNQIGYKYECLNCGNVDFIKQSRILNNKGCNICCISSKKIKENINSVYATNPEFVKYFVNTEDSKHITLASSKKVWLKCPRCNCKRFVSMNTVYTRLLEGYFPCKKCSDKKPYGEKFVFNILYQLNIDFKTEFSDHWCKNIKHGNNKISGDKRYDFYFELNNEKYIIETHGGQHYKQTNISRGKGRNLQDEQENDKIKKELAICNGIKEENYIVINTSVNSYEFVKNNIINSKLNNILYFNSVNWDDCHLYAINSLVGKVCELWNEGHTSTIEIEKITKIPNHRICKYLKQGEKIGLCNYDAKEEMRKGFIKGQQNSTIACSKPLICLNDLSVFCSINDCERKSKEIYGRTYYHERIGKACLNGDEYAGLRFKFIKDLTNKEYIKYNIEDKLKEKEMVI